jgi:flagellar motor component MotA
VSEKPSHAEILKLLVEQAPALRKAGVAELEVEGFKVRLSPYAGEDDSAQVSDGTSNAIDEDDDVFSKPVFPALQERVRLERERMKGNG